MLTMAMYPEHWSKYVRVGGERGRQHAVVRARAMQEGIQAKAVLTGEDICSQKGPMVSPEYLRQDYFEMVEYAIEPLVKVGAKVVWHCDGNVRPLLDDLLACGLGGLQGFQRECGMELEWIVERKTRSGDPLVIFGPMSVTKTLPHGTPDDVRTEVRTAMTLCRDKASLVFFTANTINPDVPLENIRAYWDAVHSSTW
jgi:uroporphyrinogen decarboxylase